jgi:collagenase-like PrtC family protease
MNGKLTLGPILFHWSAEKKRDFYFQIADEAPVDTVYLGEVVCSKRAPFFEQYYAEVAERLISAGKKVVFSSLAEVMIPRERKMTAGLCELEEFEVEANDTSALYHLRGKPHRIGQYFNTYNEETLRHLAEGGATHITLPAELPRASLAALSEAAQANGICLEVQVYGRVGLALSARCYHARAHGRVKDNCQFICEEDPDGMLLKTLGGQDFLCVNGVQTLSYTCLNLIHEMVDMAEMGIRVFRLSPHHCDMVAVSKYFHDVLCGHMAVEEAERCIVDVGLNAPSSNGFYHGREGYSWGHG